MGRYLRRMVFFVLLLVGLMAVGLAAAHYVGRHVSYDDYNCLNVSDQFQVELNTHLELVQEIVHSTSPDGTYQIVSVLRPPDSRRLFLENTRTKQSVALPNDVLVLDKVVWSHNGVYLAYMWQPMSSTRYITVMTTEGELLGEIRSYPFDVLEFSPDNEYLVIKPAPDSVRFFSIPELSYVTTRDITNVSTFIYDWYADNLIIYLTSDQLVVKNIDTGEIHSALLPHAPVDIHRTSVNNWSPGGRYVTIYSAVSTQESNPDLPTSGSHLYIFKLEDDAITFVTDMIHDHNGYWISSLHWLPNGNQLTYIKQIPTMPQFEYELWRYDVETRKHDRLLTHLRSYSFSGNTWATVRKDGDISILEFIDQETLNRQNIYSFSTYGIGCDWNTLIPQRPILECEREDGGNLILFDEQGIVVWPTELSEGTNVYRINAGFSDRGTSRFIPIMFELGNQYTIELLDVRTLQTFEYPRFVSGAILEIFRVYPSPDDKIWLVYFRGDLYRLDPTRATWLLIHSGEYVESVHWTPDSQRYLVVLDTNVSFNSRYVVWEADTARKWELGTFDSDVRTLTNTHWTHCGDILAPLRDRLAAESLN